MINYMRSELYRIAHSKGIYIFTLVLMAFGILINGILCWVGILDGPSFPYDSTSFSYSNIVATPTLFYAMSAIIASLLYEGNRRNGNLKNSVAFGISRTKIFIGEILVGIIICMISVVCILGTYIISAELLLESTGVYTRYDIMNELIAVFFIAVAGHISAILFIEFFDKHTAVLSAWIMIWILIPIFTSYLGLRFDMVKKFSDWLPHNFFAGEEMQILFGSKLLIWDSTSGMAKCLISGTSGILIFTILGILLLRKKDI